MNYFHYTKAICLPHILNDGYIRLSTKFIRKHEKPVVWLTKSEQYERTCTLATDENVVDLIGRARIRINSELPTITFARFRYVSGIDDNLYLRLKYSAIDAGSDITKWYCSLNPIPEKYWLGFELLTNKGWEAWTGKEEIKTFLEDRGVDFRFYPELYERDSN
jgi:hypothetical protein